MIIDGSYLTDEIDPLDIDFAVVVTPEFYESCSREQRKLLDWIGDDKTIRDTLAKKALRRNQDSYCGGGPACGLVGSSTSTLNNGGEVLIPPHHSTHLNRAEETMAAIETATLLKLIVELIGTVGGLIQTSIRHGERLRGIQQQLVAMKEAIERGHVQTDAKLAAIAASVSTLRDEMLTLISEEMKQQREERKAEFEQLSACMGQWINAATRPLYYSIAALGAAILVLAAEVTRLAVQLPHLR